MKFNGAEILIHLLEMHEVDTLFGMPGGANLPIYDALSKSGIRHVLARHEQGAAFMAQGKARSTGKPAVTLATSGPGATNLLTALADARMDSVPLIAITGQVSRGLMGTAAFQEVDMCAMSQPVCKRVYQPQTAGDLLHIVPEAYRAAAAGRPGPVLIDIPKDVQLETAEFNTWPQIKEPPPKPEIESHEVLDITTRVNSAKRPLMMIGGGAILSGASVLISTLSRKNSIPVISTLMGLGAIHTNDPLYLGMLGMHGHRRANKALGECDLLIALGVRFNDRTTGKLDDFCPQADVIHIDIDASEIYKNIKAGISLCADLTAALRAVALGVRSNDRPEWTARIASLSETYPIMETEAARIDPVRLIQGVSAHVLPDTIIVADVGQHQMWVARHYPFKAPRTFLTSGGLGTMGFALPAAIGAAIHSQQTVVCFTGDGSFYMNMQEIATLAELKLNVKVLILNNGQLGMVRQQQAFFYGGRYAASSFEKNSDFAAVSEAMGVPGMSITEPGQTDALFEALSRPGPACFDIALSDDLNVTPMVPPGESNQVMIDGTETT